MPFIWFLDANGLLYRKDDSKRLADNALVALTLLIAESKPVEKCPQCGKPRRFAQRACHAQHGHGLTRPARGVPRHTGTGTGLPHSVSG